MDIVIFLLDTKVGMLLHAIWNLWDPWTCHMTEFVSEEGCRYWNICVLCTVCIWHTNSYTVSYMYKYIYKKNSNVVQDTTFPLFHHQNIISPPWDPTVTCHLSVTKGCKGVFIKIFVKFLPASVEGDWSRFEGKHKIHFVQMTKWLTIFYTPAILHGKVFFHWNIFQFDGKSTQARERRMFSHN